MIFDSFSNVLGLAVTFNIAAVSLVAANAQEWIFNRLFFDKRKLSTSLDKYLDAVKIVIAPSDVEAESALDKAINNAKEQLNFKIKTAKEEFESELNKPIKSSIPCICLFLALFALLEMILDGFNIEWLSRFLLFWNISVAIAVLWLFLINSSNKLKTAIPALGYSVIGGLVLYATNEMLIASKIQLFDYDKVLLWLRIAIIVPFVGFGGYAIELWNHTKKLNKNIDKIKSDIEASREMITASEELLKTYSDKTDNIINTFSVNCESPNVEK